MEKRTAEERIEELELLVDVLKKAYLDHESPSIFVRVQFEVIERDKRREYEARRRGQDIP